MRHGPLQSFELQRNNLVARGDLDRIKAVSVWCKVAHAGVSLFGSMEV
jgi:hypothetical protein